MRRLIPFLLLLSAIWVGGCGGGAASGNDDPARLVPADSAMYIEAVVRPHGNQGDAAKSFAGTLLDTDDPGAEIRSLIDDATSEDGATFDKDIDPWLGDRIGLALTDLQRDEPRYTVVIPSRDEDAANSAIADHASKEKARKSGDHWVDPDGSAYALVDGSLVAASDEKTFARALAAKDGEHLSDSKRFQDALDTLPDERIGTFYVDTPRLLDSIVAEANDPVSGAVARQLFGGGEPIAVAAVAGDDTLTLESATKSAGPLFGLSTGGTTPLLQELPAGSWLAFGAKDVGHGAKAIVGAFGAAFLQGQLEQLGLDLDRDVFSWIGDVAVFVRGDSAAAVRGGAVIEVTDHDRAASAIRKLVGLAQQQADAPFKPTQIEGAELAFSAQEPDMADAVVVALGDDRAVIAYGAEAATDALNPSKTIAQDGLYGRAKDATGGLDPTLVLDAVPVLKLIEESVAADPDFAKAKPYLDKLDLVASGSGKDGDRLRQRLVVKLR